jgi:hypothetical protein
VHRSIRWVCLPVGVLAIACGKTSQTAANGDLQRDLKLAATANLDLATQSQSTKYALVETAPESKQTDARSLKKNPGPKAIRSKTPTVKAAPDFDALAASTLPPLEMMAEAPAPTTVTAVMPTNPLPAATSSLPAPVQTRGAGTEGSGTGSEYPGTGMRPGINVHGMGPDGDTCGPPRPGMGGGYFPPVMIPMVAPGGSSGSAPRGSGGAAPRARGGRGGM